LLALLALVAGHGCRGTTGLGLRLAHGGRRVVGRTQCLGHLLGGLALGLAGLGGLALAEVLPRLAARPLGLRELSLHRLRGLALGLTQGGLGGLVGRLRLHHGPRRVHELTLGLGQLPGVLSAGGVGSLVSLLSLLTLLPLLSLLCLLA